MELFLPFFLNLLERFPNLLLLTLIQSIFKAAFFFILLLELF
jgi:hypothetical protein